MIIINEINNSILGSSEKNNIMHYYFFIKNKLLNEKDNDFIIINSVETFKIIIVIIDSFGYKNLIKEEIFFNILMFLHDLIKKYWLDVYTFRDLNEVNLRLFKGHIFINYKLFNLLKYIIDNYFIIQNNKIIFVGMKLKLLDLYNEKDLDIFLNEDEKLNELYLYHIKCIMNHYKYWKGYINN